MSLRTERAVDRALERARTAESAVGEAIGTLEMGEPGSDLLVGWSGATALRALREARKGVQKAKALLEALGGGR